MGGGPLPPDPPPPHALTSTRPAALTASSTTRNTPRRLRIPKQQSRTASAVTGKSGREPRRISADVDAVETVSVVDAAAVPVGVTVAGAKLQVAPAGKPEQAKDTAELKPLAGVTETVVVPLLPAATVKDTGKAAIVKVGGNLMV